MISRELKPAMVLTYDDTLDEYGQPNKSEPKKRPCEITLRIYKHTQVEDIRFNDVTHTALTYDKQITDSNKILYNGDTYSVIFVNPEGRLSQLFLKKEH